jgi:hypothetical protein
VPVAGRDNGKTRAAVESTRVEAKGGFWFYFTYKHLFHNSSIK